MPTTRMTTAEWLSGLEILRQSTDALRAGHPAHAVAGDHAQALAALAALRDVTGGPSLRGASLEAVARDLVAAEALSPWPEMTEDFQRLQQIGRMVDGPSRWLAERLAPITTEEAEAVRLAAGRVVRQALLVLAPDHGLVSPELASPDLESPT